MRSLRIVPNRGSITHGVVTRMRVSNSALRYRSPANSAVIERGASNSNSRIVTWSNSACELLGRRWPCKEACVHHGTGGKCGPDRDPWWHETVQLERCVRSSNPTALAHCPHVPHTAPSTCAENTPVQFSVNWCSFRSTARKKIVQLTVQFFVQLKIVQFIPHPPT